MSFDFSTIVEPIKAVFERHASSVKKGAIEIEGRLGIYDHENKKFDTNIGEEYYTNIKEMLDSCKEWNSVENIDTTDHINDKFRLSTNNKTASVSCIEKKKLASFTITSETTPLDFRITISVEIPVKVEKFSKKNVSIQRDKNRYQYKLDDYSYDLTKIATTTTKKEEHFEYEVERLSETEISKDMGQTVFSIIMKLLDASYACDGFLKTRDNSLPIEGLNLTII